MDDLIKSVAPSIVFHPQEQYFMSSVDDFLGKATLHKKDGPSQTPALGHLPTTGKDDGLYWLDIDPSARGGDLAKAVAYVHAKRNAEVTDLTFWLFSPFNGAGILLLKPFKDRISLQDGGFPFGEHTGDWEHVTVRVGNASGRPERVYLPQHDSGEWLSFGDLSQHDGRPVVYASLHGHASYAKRGANLSHPFKLTLKEVLSILPDKLLFEFALRNETDTSSHTFDCRTYQLLAADFVTPRPAPPPWLDYPYRWGLHKTYPLKRWQQFLETYTKVPTVPLGTDIVAKIAEKLLGKLPGELKEQNGPTGPKQKGSWNRFE